MTIDMVPAGRTRAFDESRVVSRCPLRLPQPIAKPQQVRSWEWTSLFQLVHVHTISLHLLVKSENQQTHPVIPRVRLSIPTAETF